MFVYSYNSTAVSPPSSAFSLCICFYCRKDGGNVHEVIQKSKKHKENDETCSDLTSISINETICAGLKKKPNPKTLVEIGDSEEICHPNEIKVYFLS